MLQKRCGPQNGARQVQTFASIMCSGTKRQRNETNKAALFACFVPLSSFSPPKQHNTHEYDVFALSTTDREKKCIRLATGISPFVQPPAKLHVGRTVPLHMSELFGGAFFFLFVPSGAYFFFFWCLCMFLCMFVFVDAIIIFLSCMVHHISVWGSNILA